MSCYAHREDPERLVDLFNRTVAPVAGRARLSTHLCFGNYKGRAVAPRQYAPLFPAFLGVAVDEIHLEMASRELAEAELVGTIAETEGRRRRRDRRQELLRRDARGRGRARATVRAAGAAGAARLLDRLRPQPDRALGGEAEARRTSSPASGSCATSCDRAVHRRHPRLVARAERLPDRSRGPAPARRPLSLRLADREVRGHRDAARPDAPTRRRARAARLRRRRALDARPHRPPRRRDAARDRRAARRAGAHRRAGAGAQRRRGDADLRRRDRRGRRLPRRGGSGRASRRALRRLRDRGGRRAASTTRATRPGSTPASGASTSPSSRSTASSTTSTGRTRLGSRTWSRPRSPSRATTTCSSSTRRRRTRSSPSASGSGSPTACSRLGERLTLD